MVVSKRREGHRPGSGETSPNPVFCATPTQPDQTSAAAGAARTSSGQDRTARSGRAAAGDRSAAAGPPVRVGDRPLRSVWPVTPARRASVMSGVPDPVAADALGGYPGQVGADAGPQVVIAAAGDRLPAGVPEQLPVPLGVPLLAVLHQAGH